MDFLKQWTFCVCITLIVSVIFLLFTPRGKLSGFYKMLISLFIFISFLYPLRDFDFKDYDFDYSFSQEEFDASTQKSYETMLRTQIQSVLEQNKIYHSKIDCSVRMDNAEATVKKVVIAVGDEYELTDVQSIVFDNLGINAQVIHIGD